MSASSSNQSDSTRAPSARDYDELVHFVRALSESLRDFDLSSIDVELVGTRIRLRTARHAPVGLPAEFSAPLPHAAPAEQPEGPGDDASEYIVAPMIGTYYASPAPGDPPFVVVGDAIEPGQTIAIIEAMKIMNEIVTDRGGVIQEILVRNAQAVEYGQPLVRISPIGE
jgi:acetyl-CoA carboxylase biotin carboxyl carrier protein